jgi:hypothetical protein
LAAEPNRTSSTEARRKATPQADAQASPLSRSASSAKVAVEDLELKG